MFKVVFLVFQLSNKLKYNLRKKNLRSLPTGLTFKFTHPFVKFETFESDNYWEYCKYSLISYKPFQNNINNLVGDKEDPEEEDWIYFWIKFRDEKKTWISYFLNFGILELSFN